MGLAKLSTTKAERKANQIKVSKLMRYQGEKPKVEDELAPPKSNGFQVAMHI